MDGPQTDPNPVKPCRPSVNLLFLWGSLMITWLAGWLAGWLAEIIYSVCH